MFETFFSPSRQGEATNDWHWNPAVDIYDEENQIVVKAELAGVDKKDIDVKVEGRVLTLRGERNEEKEVNDERFHRRERVSGKFERVFRLPTDVDSDQIRADYKDGVLKVVIPKPEAKQAKQVTIH
jgi:HSP20 family protein